MNSKKYKCPCCEYYTLEEEPTGTYQICPVCYWEDDNVQFYDPAFWGGANEMSLNLAKQHFKLFGAVDKRFLKYVRKPFESEKNASL